MPKKLISIKLGEQTLGVVTKYQEDHHCDRTKAIIDMIDAYPLLKVKSEQHDLGQKIKEEIPKEAIMPDLCIHIDDLDLNRDAIHCSKKKAWCKSDACQRCADREAKTDQ